MTDNDAVIKVARWCEWNIRINDYELVLINEMDVVDPRTHQLLMLAVLEKMGGALDYSSKLRGDVKVKYYLFDSVGWSDYMPVADLPLAVINACAERIKEER